jgi:hypothetical protein
MPLVIARRPGESLAATYPDGTVVYVQVADLDTAAIAARAREWGVAQFHAGAPSVNLIVRAPPGSIVMPKPVGRSIGVRRTKGELVTVTPPGKTPIHFRVLKVEGGRGARLVTICDREVHIDRINREGKNERKTKTQPRS